jgi:hypothetical protein
MRAEAWLPGAVWRLLSKPASWSEGFGGCPKRSSQFCGKIIVIDIKGEESWEKVVTDDVQGVPGFALVSRFSF